LKPAKVVAGHGEESAIRFNRRFHMTDGTVGWNPGKFHPKILKAAGPIDPDLAVVHKNSPRGPSPSGDGGIGAPVW
jgi:hypothetical protein